MRCKCEVNEFFIYLFFFTAFSIQHLIYLYSLHYVIIKMPYWKKWCKLCRIESFTHHSEESSNSYETTVGSTNEGRMEVETFTPSQQNVDELCSRSSVDKLCSQSNVTDHESSFEDSDLCILTSDESDEGGEPEQDLSSELAAWATVSGCSRGNKCFTGHTKETRFEPS